MTTNGTHKIDDPLLRAVGAVIKDQLAKAGPGARRVELPTPIIEIPAPVLAPIDVSPIAAAIKLAIESIPQPSPLDVTPIAREVRLAIESLPQIDLVPLIAAVDANTQMLAQVLQALTKKPERKRRKISGKIGDEVVTFTEEQS